jgi:hypothetical protein
MNQLQDVVDFSRLPKRHILYCNRLENKLGAWKLSQLNIREVVSLKVRLYSYYTQCDLCHCIYNPDCDFCQVYSRGRKVAAGFTKITRDNMDHDFFRNVLFPNPEFDGPNQPPVVNILDDRRYWDGQSFDSLPHGHYMIN